MAKTKNIKPFKFVREYKNTLWLHYFRVRYPDYVTWAKTLHFYFRGRSEYDFYIKRKEGKVYEWYFAFWRFAIIFIDHRTFYNQVFDMPKYYRLTNSIYAERN